MNKKGNAMLIIYFFLALFLIIFIGFILVVGSAVLNWVFDETVPELTDLGQVGDANMTDIASYTITPLNNIVQSFTWLVGILYVLMIVASIGIIFIFRGTPSRWLIGLYFMLAVMLIIGCIFMSNMYEDFYKGNDDLGNRLKEHTIASYMILYSPLVMTLVVFVTGIILFSGMQQEEFV